MNVCSPGRSEIPRRLSFQLSLTHTAGSETLRHPHSAPLGLLPPGQDGRCLKGKCNVEERKLGRGRKELDHEPSSAVDPTWINSGGKPGASALPAAMIWWETLQLFSNKTYSL